MDNLERVMYRCDPSHTEYRFRAAAPAAPGGATRGLPPCAQTMLADGVTEHQRVACFRLAVNLKKAGLRFDSAVAVLTDWATRNRPRDRRRIITRQEIVSQTACAFDKAYRTSGCEDAAVSPYCDTGCPVRTNLAVELELRKNDVHQSSTECE